MFSLFSVIQKQLLPQRFFLPIYPQSAKLFLHKNNTGNTFNRCCPCLQIVAGVGPEPTTSGL